MEVDLVQEHVPDLDPALLADSKITFQLTSQSINLFDHMTCAR